MADILNVKVNEFMAKVIARNPGESEFHQAVQEVVESLELVLDRHPEYRAAKILEVDRSTLHNKIRKYGLRDDSALQ